MFAAVLMALTASMATPAPSELSTEAESLIAPVHNAYSQVAAAQAQLPAATSDRGRLERMFAMDQAGREALNHVDLAKLPEPQRKLAHAAIWSEIAAHDVADQVALKNMMPATGWFLPDVYGKEAASAAFLIVQHAVNDPKLMRSTLVRLEPLAREGKIDGGEYALMYDRVALEFDHKPQRYGSQASCKGGTWEAQNVENPNELDKRRLAVGLKQTEAEYLALFKDMPCN